MQSWDTRKSFGGKAQASKGRQSLSIDLSTTALFTFTSARRTKPFLQVRTSITLPRGHVLRGEFSALISSKAIHFCLLWSRSRYSLNHRFQKVSARYCTCLHLGRDKESSFWNNPGGIWGSDCKRSKWLGVKSSGSCESLETILQVVTHMGVKYPLDILL